MPAAAILILITLPWLNPFSPGPSSNVGPLLFAWACAAGVLLALALDRQRGQHPQMVRTLVLAWVLASALSAEIGLLQYFGASGPFGIWLNHTELGQAFGNLRQRNQFAALMNLGLLAALWLASGPHATAPAFGPRLGLSLALALAALLGVGNAASASRTGLLQLLLVAGLALWWQRRRTASQPQAARRVQAVVLTALLTYALATIALPMLAGLDPANSGAWARLRAGDAACASRLTLWGNVLTLIGQKPWLGWGWGELDYAHFITLYPGTRFCDILDNAHNLPLHLAVELGVPLALLICGAGLWLLWRAQPWREPSPTRQLAWGALAVILLHSLLEYPLWYGPFQMAAAASLWLLWWVPRQPELPSTPAARQPLPGWGYGLAALLILAPGSFAAWQYHIASQIYLKPSQRDPAYQGETLQKIKDVALFGNAVRFAELTTTPLTLDNAESLNALAHELLHFSPEVRVVERLIDSARLLGREPEVAFFSARYQAAFPQAYALWHQRQAARAAPP